MGRAVKEPGGEAAPRDPRPGRCRRWVRSRALIPGERQEESGGAGEGRRAGGRV